MITLLRNIADTMFAKILIGILALSFVAWGGTAALVSPTSSSVANVNDASITAQEFYRAYQTEVRRLQGRLPNVTPEQMQLLGIPQNVLQRLVSEQVSTNHADQLKLGVSDATIAESIRQDQSFTTITGDKFDRDQFESLLQRSGFSEKEYVANLRDLERRLQIYDAMMDKTTAPQLMQSLQKQFAQETRQIGYVILPALTKSDVDLPADDVLQAYYDTNKKKYDAPEYRNIEIAILDPEDMLKLDEIDEADIEKTFNARKSALEKPATRKIEQILIKDEDTLAKVTKALEDNKSFDDILNMLELNPADADLGVVEASSFSDKVLAEQIFAIKEEGTSPVLKGEFDQGLYRISQITEATTVNLEDHQDRIRHQLALKHAQNQAEDMLDTIDEGLSEGKTIQEIAPEHNLKVINITSSAEGKTPSGTDIDEFPAMQQLLNAAFKAEIDGDNNAIEAGNKATLWFNVEDIIASAERPLEDAKFNVLDDWLSEQAKTKLTERANSLKEEMIKGAKLEVIAEREGLSYHISEPFTRLAGLETIGATTRFAAFGGPEGHKGLAEGLDRSQVLFAVTLVTDGEPLEDEEQLQQKLSESLSNDLYIQHTTALRAQSQISVNQAILTDLVNQIQ